MREKTATIQSVNVLKNIPQPEDFVKLWHSCYKGISATAHVMIDDLGFQISGKQGWLCRQSFFKGQFALAEGLRQEWRNDCSYTCDISLNGAGKGRFDDMGCQLCYWEDLFIRRGNFGVAEYYACSDAERNSWKDLHTHKKTQIVMKAIMACIDKFCHVGQSASPHFKRSGILNKPLKENIINGLTSVVFDMESAVQQASREWQNAGELPNIKLVVGDLMHRLRHDMHEPAVRELSWKEFRFELKQRKHPFTKQVTHSTRMRQNIS